MRLWTEADIARETARFCALPYVFDGFADMPEMTDGVVTLYCAARRPADPARAYVPAYVFRILVAEEPVGQIDLRIGYTEGLFYGGHIGYAVDAAYRGNGYAVRACRLLAPWAAAHQMPELWITTKEDNRASGRVCEKLGAEYRATVPLPAWTELYQEGQRFVNLYTIRTAALRGNGEGLPENR